MNTSAKSIFTTGSVLDGKWVLMERIGKGGMGEVYRAHQLNLKRDVAIKVISEEVLQESEDNPEALATMAGRFQREVQTMAQVRHPNVLQIFDYGTAKTGGNGQSQPVEYIAMEYVPGNTLRYTMSDYGFGEEDQGNQLIDWLQRYYLPVLDGVEAIHAHGIVHRDMKPENILLDDDTPKIADFGLARSLQIRAVSNSWDVKGTWPYMAPEQFSEFRKAGFAADIYALGKILFEAINGKLDVAMVPFKSVALKDPRTPLLKDLDRIIRKATQENQGHRYQQVVELRHDVKAAVDAHLAGRQSSSGTTRAPANIRWLWTGIVVALMAVVGMTIYHLTRRPSVDPAVAVRQRLSQTEKSAPVQQPEPSPTRLALDGRTMLLVAATPQSAAIYADRSLITFHHYVEFLNAVADQVDVRDGVVKKGKEIWIYLGDGSAPSDQIIYEQGKFFLRQAEWAPHPVVRVTWLGARAYAHHFNKRLPTYAEWKALMTQPEIAAAARPPAMVASGGSPHSHMMQVPPSAAPGDATGTPGREPESAAPPVTREWLSDSLSAGIQSADQPLSHIVQWSVGTSTETLPPVRRYPWEGFEDVGFRTVMDIGTKQAVETGLWHRLFGHEPYL